MSEKEFSITFDLNNIEILIPSGRMMNLKDRLGWNDIKFEDAELKTAIKDIAQDHFSVEKDFTVESEKFIKDTIDNKNKQKIRMDYYLSVAKEQIIRPEFFAEVTHNLTEELRSEMSGFVNSIAEKDLITKKLQKLAQLKQINNII